MSLSLDDVRNIKFRMAKRSGYEVLDVDEFVDQVEEAFAQLQEENANLKRQVDSLKRSAPSESSTDAAPAEPTPAPTPAPAPAPVAQPSDDGPPANLPIVVTTSKEASTAVVRLVEMSTDQAERLVAEAESEANRIREDANRSAHQVTTDARTRAERVESEARVNADRTRSDAQRQADQLNADTDAKRVEMFGALEQQKDQLSASVEELRRFEEAYRSNLTAHLQSQIETVSGLNAEPSDAPASLSSAAGDANGSEPTGARSATPRLDALLGDQR
jgi:DivIVA domain-containing protein